MNSSFGPIGFSGLGFGAWGLGTKRRRSFDPATLTRGAGELKGGRGAEQQKGLRGRAAEGQKGLRDRAVEGRTG